MIRRIERKKALGMSRCCKNLGCICDADIFVARRVAHQKCLLQPPQTIEKALLRDIVEELLGDGEGATRQRNLCGSLLVDLRQIGGEVMRDVGGRGWCAD